MRIELNSGGLSSGAAILDFQSDFDSLIGRSKRMVSSFQAVRNFTYNMNGGVGVLQSAVDQIDARISTEEAKTDALESVQRKANSFIELTCKVDGNVCKLVNRNKHEFYKVNSWAKPPQPEEEKSWRDKAKEWLCQKGKEIKEKINGIKDAVINWSKTQLESLSKAWNNAVEWFKENKDFIKQIAIEIAIGAAVIGLAALTGGASLAITVAIAAGAGAAIGGAGGAIDYYMENDTLKGASKKVVGNAAKGFMTGAISGYVGGQVGTVVKAHHLGRGATTILGAVSNGTASAGSEAVHALADGDGISNQEMHDIAFSGITGAVMGGHSAYKSHNEFINVGSSADVLKANNEFVKTQENVIIQNAKDNMKKGISNSIYNAQEYKKDLVALNKTLYKSIIRDEIIDSTKDEMNGLVSQWIFEPSNEN